MNMKSSALSVLAFALCALLNMDVTAASGPKGNLGIGKLWLKKIGFAVNYSLYLNYNNYSL